MFDFHRIYSTYATTDLLKIVAQPQHYQPAAVEAARQILQQRTISEDERAESAAEIEGIDEKENQPDAATRIIGKTQAIVAYLLTPSKTFDVRKWNYWLCVILVVVLVSGWINGIQFLWRATTGHGYTMHWTMLAQLFSILYEVSMILLLLRRQTLGWLMLITFCSYEVIGRIYFFLLIKYFPYPLVMAIIVILMYLLLLRLLAKPRVVVYFKGNYRLYKKSMVAGVIFSLLFLVLISMDIS